MQHASAGEGFNRLHKFRDHLKNCKTEKNREKQGLDEKQIQIIGLVRHLRDQASKQVDQELGLVQGRGCTGKNIKAGVTRMDVWKKDAPS